MKTEMVESLVTLARHSGRCAGCRGRIFCGDPIVRVSATWLHEECVPFEADLAAIRVDRAVPEGD